jgi:hypothetical protein
MARSERIHFPDFTTDSRQLRILCGLAHFTRRAVVRRCATTDETIAFRVKAYRTR